MGQTAIVLVALLAAAAVLAVMVIVLASRARRLREGVRHEREVARRRILALTGGDGTAWSGQVAVSEVLHAATRSLGDDGQDVTRRADTNRTLPGPVAHDVCVILSELVDNALCFSDVSEEITVFARAANDGSVLIEVEDSGEGMSRDDLRLANRTLKGAPPDEGVEGLGLVLAGRLAARHGIRVVLAARGDGTMASIVVPPAVAGGQQVGRPALPASPPATPAPATPQRAAPPRQPVSSIDSGESTAAWTPPWAGSGEGRAQPAPAGREAARASRPEPSAAPRPAATAPHGIPARAAAAGGGHPPPARPAARPASPSGSGTSALPLPPAPPGLDSNAPGWLTSSPDSDPAQVPHLGGYASTSPGAGSDPYAAAYRGEGYGGSGAHGAPGGEFGSPIFDSVASRWFDGPSSPDQHTWQSPGDHGWSAAERAYNEPSPPAGALPRREPMSHLVPGSVQPSRPARPPAWDEPPSPDTWATYRNQVDHGRRAWFRQVGDDADGLGGSPR